MSMGVKMTKQQLKELVKECLVEILQDGLGSVLQTPTEPRPRATSLPRAQEHHDRRELPGKRRPSAALAEAIRAEARGNPLMADIFADTAMTTLPKMLSNGDSAARPAEGTQASVSQQEQFTGTPEQIFGEEISSKWANLAFMEPASKKTA